MQTINKCKFEQRFKELFFDEINKIKIRLYFNLDGDNLHEKVFFNKNGEYLGEYDQYYNKFWLSYSKIWSLLQSEFILNDQEIKDLTKDMLEEHYKLKGVTTSDECLLWAWPLEEHYKLKGVTTSYGGWL